MPSSEASENCTIVACRSLVTSDRSRASRYVRTLPTPARRTSAASPRTSAWNCGASTVYLGERTTTMSVTALLAVGGNARSSASSARCDCGLLVGLPSVVSAPPSSAPIATTAATTRTIQPAIVRHGCRALIIASVCVESFTNQSPPASFDLRERG
jgi:hypothetical protein